VTSGRVRLTRRGRVVVVALIATIVIVGGWVVFAGGSGGAPTPTTAASGTSSDRPTSGPSPGTTTGASPTSAAASLPACRYGALPSRDAGYGAWSRTLLDTTFALPADYSPPDLVSVTQAGSEGVGVVRSFVIPDLKALLRASDAAGTPVEVLVAFRSFARQQQLFHENVQRVGREEALAKTARPGHSEHQLGTTIDFRTKGDVDVDENWESQPAGAWMAANGWRFGFVMSYPSGKEDVTCYSYEPWHYRYFGRTLAGRIRDSGLTPREFLWRMDEPSPTGPS
jgi:zinc D-Ala-D-Ala carboxypeptidase